GCAGATRVFERGVRRDGRGKSYLLPTAPSAGEPLTELLRRLARLNLNLTREVERDAEGIDDLERHDVVGSCTCRAIKGDDATVGRCLRHSHLRPERY